MGVVEKLKLAGLWRQTCKTRSEKPEGETAAETQSFIDHALFLTAGLD